MSWRMIAFRRRVMGRQRDELTQRSVPADPGAPRSIDNVDPSDAMGVQGCGMGEKLSYVGAGRWRAPMRRRGERELVHFPSPPLEIGA